MSFKEEFSDGEVLWGALRGLLVEGQAAVTRGERTLHWSHSAFRAPGCGALRGTAVSDRPTLLARPWEEPGQVIWESFTGECPQPCV